MDGVDRGRKRITNCGRRSAVNIVLARFLRREENCEVGEESKLSEEYLALEEFPDDLKTTVSFPSL